jgi:dephospho-CoA kinase
MDRGPYCILAIPLLAENFDQYGWVDRVLLVDTPRALQIDRLMQRDGISRGAAQRMLDAQATREQRLAIADDVIVNNGEVSEMDAQVAALHARYLESAGRRPIP